MKNNQTDNTLVETKNVWVDLKQFHEQNLSPKLVQEMNYLGREVFDAGGMPRILHKDTMNQVLDNHIILEKNMSGLYEITQNINLKVLKLFKPFFILFLIGSSLGIILNNYLMGIIIFLITTMPLSFFLGYAIGAKLIDHYSIQKHKNLIKMSLYMAIFTIANLSFSSLFNPEIATRAKDIVHYADLTISFTLLVTLAIYTRKITQWVLFLLLRKQANSLLSIVSSKEIKELEEQYFNYSSRALDKRGFDIAVWLHIEENKKLIVSLPELKTNTQETIMVSKSDIDFEKLLHKIIYRTKEEDLISFQETFLKNIYPLTYSTNKNFIHIGDLPVDEEKLATLVAEKPL